MPHIEPTNSMCCFSLEGGLKGLAWIEAVYRSLQLLAAILKAPIWASVYPLVMLSFSSSLIVAVNKRKRFYLLPSIVYSVLVLLLLLMLLIAALVYHKEATAHGLNPPGVLLLFSVGWTFQLYYLYCLHSLFVRLRAEEQPKETRKTSKTSALASDVETV